MEVRLMPPRQTSLAALLAIALALPVFGQRAELQRRIQRQVLPNGLEVIVVDIAQGDDIFRANLL